MIDYQIKQIGANGEVVLLELSGQLDSIGCDFLNSVIEGEIHDGTTRVIIDCDELQYISSLGLGTLVRLHSRMKKKGGDVKLARVQGVIAEVIRMVMLDKILSLYPTVQEAVESFE